MNQTSIEAWIEEWGTNLDWEAKAALRVAAQELVLAEPVPLTVKLSLEKIVDGYNQVFEETVKQIISELKKDCKTYAELEKKLTNFERSLYWQRETRERMESLLLRLKSFVEKEKNDLLITNRPREVKPMDLKSVLHEQIRELQKLQDENMKSGIILERKVDNATKLAEQIRKIVETRG